MKKHLTASLMLLALWISALASDLNAMPESKTLEDPASHRKQLNDRALATIHVDQPTKQVDFVFVCPLDRWKVVEVQVLEEAVASDHRAILAVLKLQPDKESWSVPLPL